MFFYAGGGAKRPDYGRNDVFINYFRIFQSKTNIIPDIIPDIIK
jgi:hypothetical protein